MQLKHLYRVFLTYPESWQVPISGSQGTEIHHLFLAEGQCGGRSNGRFRGMNHPRSRTDGTFTPNFQGIIETQDRATLLFAHAEGGSG